MCLCIHLSGSWICERVWSLDGRGCTPWLGASAALSRTRSARAAACSRGPAQWLTSVVLWASQPRRSAGRRLSSGGIFERRGPGVTLVGAAATAAAHEAGTASVWGRASSERFGECEKSALRPTLRASQWCLVVPSAQREDLGALWAWQSPTYIVVGVHSEGIRGVIESSLIGYLELPEETTLGELCARFPRVQWQAALLCAIVAATGSDGTCAIAVRADCASSGRPVSSAREISSGGSKRREMVTA